MIRSLLALFLIVPLAGCASMISSATGRLASDLSDAILEQNDPETVEAGAPAYLLLIDGLIRDNPKSEDLLRSGAKLYGAYAGVFVKDAERAQRLTDKSRAYAERALCRHRSGLCGLDQRQYDDFRAALPPFGLAWVIGGFSVTHVLSVFLHDARGTSSEISAMVNGHKIFLPARAPQELIARIDVLPRKPAGK